MKFFGWVQNKFNGGQGGRKPITASATHRIKQEVRKDEFSDWPDSLLAIGTFGNNDLKENLETSTSSTHRHPSAHEAVDPSSSIAAEDVDEDEAEVEDHLAEFTAEEIGKLQKELTKLLSRKPPPSKTHQEAQIAELPLDKFLNCPSSLEVDRRISSSTTTLPRDSSDIDNEEDIDRTIRVILGRCKDVCMEKNKKAIGKKSISFLLKKVFACSSGFSTAPAPSLRDILQESRMEKLLRVMLSKKIYSQNSPRASSMKKFIDDTHRPKTEKDEDEIHREKINDGCKWVKTDSEYIVLEI